METIEFKSGMKNRFAKNEKIEKAVKKEIMKSAEFMSGEKYNSIIGSNILGCKLKIANKIANKKPIKMPNIINPVLLVQARLCNIV